MKNSSKVKYFGAVAAALLAVAPIAAPVVSQIASPSVTQAADLNGVSTKDVEAIQGVLAGSAHGKEFDSATDALRTLTASNALNSSATTPLDAADFFGTGKPASGFFGGNYNTYASTFNPAGTAGTAYKYEVSGNGLTTSSSIADIQNNISTAIYSGKGATYNVTYDIYDKSNNNAVIGQFTFVAKIPAAGQAGQFLASGAFTAASVDSGSNVPGSIDSFAAIAPSVAVKNGSGSAYTLSSATDFDLPQYSTAATRPADPSVSTTWADSVAALQKRGLVNAKGTQYASTGIFYQVLPLRNQSTHVRDLVDNLKSTAASAGVTLTSGYVNNSDLYYSTANNGTLYLVRPVTVTASDTELSKPSFFYQYETLPSAPAQYFGGATINLNAGDTNRLLSDDSIAVNSYTKGADKTVDAINMLITGRLTAKETGKAGADAATIKPLTSDDVRKAAVAAGVTFKSNDDTAKTADTDGDGLADYYQYTNTKNFSVPVSVTNAAGFTSTVYIPASSHPAAPATQAAPVVELKQGVSKDITVQVGSNFQVNSLKDGLIVYTDATKTNQLPEQYWVASPTSVDTSKPGKTDVVWTFTNPQTGAKSTYTRTVTVVASDKSIFENTSGVISIQTSKAPQYTYDAASDSFKKADSYTQLKLASAWKYNQKATTTNGDVYYRVSANGYVKASDVTTAKVTPQFGVVTVNNDNGTKTYANTTKDSGAVQSIKPDTSWKFFAVAVNPDGSRAYLVADNQWIPASDVVERVQAASGVFTVGSDVAPTFNGSGSVVKGKTLKARSAWKVTGVKNINGQPYYRIATDLYVRADYGSYAK